MSDEIKEQGPVPQEIISTSSVIRQFSYDNGDAKLNFALRTDIPTEMTAFLKLLVRAIEDVRDEINNFNSSDHEAHS